MRACSSSRRTSSVVERTASSAFSLLAGADRLHPLVGLSAGLGDLPLDLFGGALLHVSDPPLAFLGHLVGVVAELLGASRLGERLVLGLLGPVGRLTGSLQASLQGVRPHRERIAYGYRDPSGLVTGAVGGLLGGLGE